MNRQENNFAILSILTKMVIQQPGIRFFQLLYNLGIKEVEPLHSEESSTTLDRLLREGMESVSNSHNIDTFKQDTITNTNKEESYKQIIKLLADII